MILGLLIISLLSALLALLLEVAASYLTDYGEKHILINEEKDLVVAGGGSLLATLMGEGIFIPSACGGKGTCAYCKVRVDDGGGPVLPTETPYLTSDDLTQNVRLSCQVKVKDDLRITIPEELFLVKEFKVRVEKITDLTHLIKEVRFQILSPEEGITFKPGQYVQLQIPKYKKSKSSEYRAYSVSSSSRDKRFVELIITKMPEGIVSSYVHDYLKEDEELIMTGPFGDFFLRESERGLLLIGTGSGLAPLISIIDQIEKEKIQRKTTLFFGDKTPRDLYYSERLKEWEKDLPTFTYIPVLSRTSEEDHWEGEKGRVTNLIEKYIPDQAEIEAYICGNPGMVQSCADLLQKKGISREHIFFDKFE
jgi:Na+-transporting NADH:ubiquinone oxidoreductase subunit F